MEELNTVLMKEEAYKWKNPFMDDTNSYWECQKEYVDSICRHFEQIIKEQELKLNEYSDVIYNQIQRIEELEEEISDMHYENSFRD